jgi:hypothetical protein
VRLIALLLGVPERRSSVMPKRDEQQKRKSRERERANTAGGSAKAPSGTAPPDELPARDTGGEPRRYEPISDELLLAAVDRAERHRELRSDGVSWADIVAHLGFVRTGSTTLQLRPQRDALIASGLLAAGRRQGFDVWSLTDAGRAHLEGARQTGPIRELPEAPQHRAWRRARANAVEVVEPLRASARAGAEEALELLDTRQRVRSDTWLLLAARLGKVYRQLGLATYCLYEWPEPDDARADIDDYTDPGDEQLDADARDRLRSARRYRRSQGNLGLDAQDRQVASAGRPITVPAEMLSELRNGLHTVLGDAAQGISQISDTGGRERHPEWYAEHRERFERTWTLLDLIGWSEPKHPSAVRLDLRQHGHAMIEALDVRLLVAEDDLKEADAVDAERAQRGEPPKRQQTLERAQAVRDFAAAVKDLAGHGQGRHGR